MAKRRGKGNKRSEMQKAEVIVLDRMVSMDIIGKARYEEKQEGRKPSGQLGRTFLQRNNWYTRCVQGEGSQGGWNEASKK